MRDTIRSLLLVFACALAAPALAQYPVKPVRLIVPYPAGGSADVVARLIAEKLTPMWKQQVVVDNKPGATGVIGTQALIASAPDGYTLMLHATAGLTIYQALRKAPAYDTLKDMTPIAPASYSPLVLVVAAPSPVNSVQALLDHIKANPGKLAYSSAGIGALNHVGTELFKRRTGADIVHVPYKGDSLAVADLINGNVAMAMLVSNVAVTQIKSGKLKGIAVTSKTRSALLPELPTMIEAGFADFDLRAWNGVVGPAGMSKELVGQVNRALGEVMANADVKARLAALGLSEDSSSPEAFAERIRAEIERWRAVVKSANVSAD